MTEYVVAMEGAGVCPVTRGPEAGAVGGKTAGTTTSAPQLHDADFDDVINTLSQEEKQADDDDEEEEVQDEQEEEVQDVDDEDGEHSTSSIPHYVDMT